MKTRNLKTQFVLAMIGAGLAAGLAQAQDAVKVPLRNPGQPVKLRVHLLHGSINVKGYDGKEVLVESKGRGRERERERDRERDRSDGLRRIDNTSGGLEITEDNNTVTIGGSVFRASDVTVTVPFSTSLNLSTVNGGDIVVEHVAGEADVDNTNGNVTLTNVSGSVVAHALNGKLIVSFDKVTPGKAMSFSTLNGSIDVTLPPDTKANLKMKADNGDIYTDFEMQVGPNRPAVVEDGRDRGGKYRVKIDRAMYGSINGGGPEMTFTTLNGKIYIRKKK
ncbi:MAG: DUF4097 family beta strand repeat-containing protein [Bryobacteraceae bacterium]